MRAASLTGFAHQELPFERLVDELQPIRDLSRTPLYQVAFDLQDEGFTTVAADGALMDAFQRSWRVAKTDLTLFMWRQEDGSLTGALEYATALFDEATVQRMADHLVRLLEAVVADPGARLSTVDFSSIHERRVMAQWNDTTAPLPAESVPDLVRAQALADPQAVAVEIGELRLTYGELDERANRLAHHLRERGVGRESTVGVLLDRGADLVVSLLAVWKAGAAYVPLDPAFPPTGSGTRWPTAGPPWCSPARDTRTASPPWSACSSTPSASRSRPVRPLRWPAPPTRTPPRTSSSPPVRPAAPRVSW
ncbi:hypothetical protein Pflav_032890 [Phytohabitans flavus]|uniref:AMP-dependent synthetase/ligase domain-containing protein n=1 Tax=Phytohabitans flavus TaxID=1076124 RepID=A0A6F8XSV9_9ACTN|nr:hypothetical protein Pflav_032890 [Phytohabitans flavus]